MHLRHLDQANNDLAQCWETDMEWLTTHWLEVVQAALAVLGAASIVAKLTPTQADDAVVQKIVDVIHALGLTKK
jgi:hypothetical protein